MYNQDYEWLKKRWLQFWNKENHDRPLIFGTVSMANRADDQNAAEFLVPENLEDRWENPAYVVANTRKYFAQTWFGGEMVPVLNPNLGPDIVGAVAGCSIEYGEDTSWAHPVVEDWETYPPIQFDENNIWWQKIRAITEAAAADAKGDYLVGITDLHPGTDGLVSLRGPQELCYDLVDTPELINGRSDEVFEVHKEMFNRLDNIIAPVQEGTVNWMGLWHPEKKWYVVGSDFSCMVSAADYDRFVLPGILQEVNFLEASVYHLDGPDALRHLDRILEIEKLNGVQWVPGEGQKPAREWISVLKKIQDAGKLVTITCTPEDILPICEELDPEGVGLFLTGCKTPEEFNGLLRKAEEICAAKRT
ncbi:MAG: trimethylamine corrinoid protein 2 [Lachnospiraceae bacterium]|nr:trimethylamine corrinoid protein 2 [Lachnospiraceae bacterium]